MLFGQQNLLTYLFSHWLHFEKGWMVQLLCHLWQQLENMEMMVIILSDILYPRI